MKNKGSALLYTVLLLSLLLTVIFGLSTVISLQFGIMKDVGNSVVAFYAADAGIERLLNAVIAQNESLTINPIDGSISGNPFSLNNGGSYSIYIKCKAGGTTGECMGAPADASCSATNFCITSSGSYKNSKRAIMVAI